MREKIAVLMGGRSLEREVSLASGKRVADALEALGYYVLSLDVTPDLVDTLRSERPDAAYIALHGKYGEDGSIQELLEFLGIPYTGPGVVSSYLAWDKSVTKHLFAQAGIPTPALDHAHGRRVQGDGRGCRARPRPACRGRLPARREADRAGLGARAHQGRACRGPRRGAAHRARLRGCGAGGEVGRRRGARGLRARQRRRSARAAAGRDRREIGAVRLLGDVHPRGDGLLRARAPRTEPCSPRSSASPPQVASASRLPRRFARRHGRRRRRPSVRARMQHLAGHDGDVSAADGGLSSGYEFPRCGI